LEDLSTVLVKKDAWCLELIEVFGIGILEELQKNKKY
jgi:hypothetical protein